MSVLKGGAASALYGLRASNGAIVINTKQGKSGKTEVSFSSTFTTDFVNKLPGQQNRWSQGSQGEFVEGVNTSWGALLDTMRYDGNAAYLFDQTGMIVPQSDPTATNQRVTPYDNTEPFFRPGSALHL